ncbi:unnamed protein product [Rotaria socialis]|uniref:Uncharacterized protein n=1 Tax=Rotaria socialis TaxID=392032 RepID=A0A821RG23_9BILA|nr:unnamed protein product [Rotaria socialis]CAF3373954.1 unnamed protein product [Rotaria socialis]CAF3387742.1 unnamed protein product [Rotaria socialis]CAF3462039.1 unnamed protein product [Rotaria socialis]CAF3542213.1 unnamed protein product [Rotaria socialis]
MPNEYHSAVFNQLFEQQRNERDAYKAVDQQIMLIRDDAADKVDENEETQEQVDENDEEQEQEQAANVVRVRIKKNNLILL